MTTSTATTPAPLNEARRIPTLDGLRGAAVVMVVLSHYFGEVQHGVRGAMFGWIGVDIFFVLSGFLIGKLILERERSANFFAVFYARRFFRIIPPYVLTLLIVVALLAVLPYRWAEAQVQFPLWSYLTFVQGFYMIAAHSIGAHWLAPTWTLAVEEHFYLLAPAAIVFTPRRWLVPALIAVSVLAVLFRVAVYFFGVGDEMMTLALLPGRADVIIYGILAAIAVRNKAIQWPHYMRALRLTPVLALAATLSIRILGEPLFQVLGPTFIGVGCTAFLLSLVLGAPEAKRFKARALRYFGDNAYCLYLTHLPVLGLMHGLILAAAPDLRTPAQWAVTLAALPVAMLVARAMTKLVEEPFTRYGRTWTWSRSTRGAGPADQILAAA